MQRASGRHHERAGGRRGHANRAAALAGKGNAEAVKVTVKRRLSPQPAQTLRHAEPPQRRWGVFQAASRALRRHPSGSNHRPKPIQRRVAPPPPATRHPGRRDSWAGGRRRAPPGERRECGPPAKADRSEARVFRGTTRRAAATRRGLSSHPPPERWASPASPPPPPPPGRAQAAPAPRPAAAVGLAPTAPTRRPRIARSWGGRASRDARQTSQMEPHGLTPARARELSPLQASHHAPHAAGACAAGEEGR